MGIDVYLSWDGQTEAEKNAQLTGFSIQHGHVGYLREAYHGGPYATRILAPEAFEAEEAEADIPAATMRERLPKVIEMAIQRERTVYDNTEVSERDPVVQSFVQFVELAESKERETGKPCRVIASY